MTGRQATETTESGWARSRWAKGCVSSSRTGISSVGWNPPCQEVGNGTGGPYNFSALRLEGVENILGITSECCPARNRRPEPLPGITNHTFTATGRPAVQEGQSRDDGITHGEKPRRENDQIRSAGLVKNSPSGTVFTYEWQ